jgi:serralysin
MALYRLGEQSLPEFPWPEVTAWSVQSSSRHTIKLANADGTFTVLHGLGFALDDAGEPISGRVLSVEHLASDGTTVIARIAAMNVPLADVRTAFNQGGFVDILLGGNDVIIGTEDSELYPSQQGFFDVIHSGAGNDIVFGRGGANLYVDGAGSDLYIGGRTSYNIDIIFDQIDYSNSPYAINLLLAGGIGSFRSHVTFDGSSDVDTLVNIETVVGSPNDDIIAVDPTFVNKEGTGRAWINGGAGNDVIHGNGETVLYYSGGGETDAVYVNLGLGIAHSLNGGPEDDLANIGFDRFTGVNQIAGSVFDDSLVGSDGEQAEFFAPGRGNDKVDGGGGAHDRYLIQTPGFGVIFNISNPDGGFATTLSPIFSFTDTVVNIEEVAATDFDDDITMSNVDNVAIGGHGNDIIRGLAGNDTLIGDEGLLLFNAPGDDTLIGGLGKDTMTGNAGHDTFDFDSILETGKTKATRDVVTDFTRGEDMIDLATIDANALVDGDQAFIWRGEQGFTGVAGQLRFIRENNPGNTNDRTIIEGDVNGDRIADFQIELTGLYRLTDHDLLL